MNFFILDELILKRLKEHVKGVARIFSALNLQDVVAQSQAVPLVATVYDGYVLKDSNPGTAQVIQRWTVVVGVKVLDYTEPAMSARVASGEIVTAVLKALQGYGPSEYPNVKRLSLAQGQGAYLENGLLLVPLVFESSVVFGSTLS